MSLKNQLIQQNNKKVHFRLSTEFRHIKEQKGRMKKKMLGFLKNLNIELRLAELKTLIVVIATL